MCLNFLCMCQALCKVFSSVFHLIVRDTLWVKHYYWPLLTDKEMVIRTGYVTCIHSYSASKKESELSKVMPIYPAHTTRLIFPHSTHLILPLLKKHRWFLFCLEGLLNLTSKFSWSDHSLLPTVFRHTLHDLSFCPFGIASILFTCSKATYILCIRPKETSFSRPDRLFPSLKPRKRICKPFLRNLAHSALYD